MNHPHFTEQLNTYAENIKIYKEMFGYYNEGPLDVEWFHKEMAFVLDEVRNNHVTHGSEQHGNLLRSINKPLIRSIQLKKDAKRWFIIDRIIIAIPTTSATIASWLYITERLF